MNIVLLMNFTGVILKQITLESNGEYTFDLYSRNLLYVYSEFLCTFNLTITDGHNKRTFYCNFFNEYI